MSNASPAACRSCWQDNYRYALYSRFSLPRLYKLAASGEWDAIPARCKTHRREAEFKNKYPPNDTALHQILRIESCPTCPPDMQQSIYVMKQTAVQALLDANPSAAADADVFQRTPLHWACMDLDGNYWNSPNHFSRRQRQQPQQEEESGDNEDDGGGNNNYHFGSSSSSSTSVREDGSIILELMDRAPNAASMIDLEKRTPLHYLVARSSGTDMPLGLLAKIVALCPEALTKKDLCGETPLDIIETRKDEIPNAIEVKECMEKLKSMLM